ncbi:hypothetical protein [Cerasicoccus frondis]|uniref:hypothetical protein n=1 Tax=Cerasicoccus frondis TaxID=490090 RepID=UPI00285277AA|nr:hypothetical protein [Cerasicoccus frondis]
MNTADFVRELASAAPSKSQLSQAGFSELEIESTLHEFECIKRSTPITLEAHDDLFLELIRDWDLSQVKIGSLSFFDEPVVGNENIELGKVELDILVFNLGSKEFQLLDHEDRNRVFSAVAQDGEKLMRGLILLADYFAKTATDEFDMDDEELGDRKVQECAALLGGKKYEGFSSTMIGF